MGNCGISSSNNKSHRIIICGLDDAGKTTVLHQMTKKECVQTVPTIGYNVEQLSVSNHKLDFFDLAGTASLRCMWKKYTKETDAIVWVVDSSNKTRMDEAAKEFETLIQDTPQSKANLLVFCNKQDVSGAMTPHEIESKLGLNKSKMKHKVLGTVAKQGQGVQEGLEFLLSSIHVDV